MALSARSSAWICSAGSVRSALIGQVPFGHPHIRSSLESFFKFGYGGENDVFKLWVTVSEYDVGARVKSVRGMNTYLIDRLAFGSFIFKKG
jgi:hypothetical protein